jgi:hypothetical protein
MSLQKFFRARDVGHLGSTSGQRAIKHQRSSFCEIRISLNCGLACIFLLLTASDDQVGNGDSPSVVGNF